MAFFKDKPSLINASLAPSKRYLPPFPPDNKVLVALAKTYNRLGGLIDLLASQNGLDPIAVLAVWYVESSGRSFTVGKPIIRFENHIFFDYWGHDHAAQFDRHFQFAGRAGITGKRRSLNHKFRKSGSGAFAEFHGSQEKEYEVLEFAASIANREEACFSISMGGPQIMGFNRHYCGYPSAADMFDNFALDERWHVLGFFDFVQSKSLIDELANLAWDNFSIGYNGKIDPYSALLQQAFGQKSNLKALARG